MTGFARERGYGQGTACGCLERRRGLSERQRTVFLLRFVEDMDLLEIAAATGMKEGTVKTHLFRALQAVRERMGGPNEPASVSPEVSQWMIGERTPQQEQHVRQCPECGAELARMEAALGCFAVRCGIGATGKCASPAPDPDPRKPRVPRPAPSSALGARRATLLLLAAVPIYRNVQVSSVSRNRPGRCAVAGAGGCRGVASVPRPMEPLAKLVSWTSVPPMDVTKTAATQPKTRRFDESIRKPVGTDLAVCRRRGVGAAAAGAAAARHEPVHGWPCMGVGPGMGRGMGRGMGMGRGPNAALAPQPGRGPWDKVWAAGGRIPRW